MADVQDDDFPVLPPHNSSVSCAVFASPKVNLESAQPEFPKAPDERRHDRQQSELSSRTLFGQLEGGSAIRSRGCSGAWNSFNLELPVEQERTSCIPTSQDMRRLGFLRIKSLPCR